jgi:hypothetical protein
MNYGLGGMAMLMAPQAMFAVNTEFLIAHFVRSGEVLPP